MEERQREKEIGIAYDIPYVTSTDWHFEELPSYKSLHTCLVYIAQCDSSSNIFDPFEGLLILSD